MKRTNQPPPASTTRRELRMSLLLPIGITLAVWIAGAAILLIFPTSFHTILALIVGASLLLYLVFWTRQERPFLRITAILLALPALAGVTWGMIQGSFRYTFAGVGVTFILLLLQRILNTPLSYRAAIRYFRAGDVENALNLVNKSIAARPDFWQSYQLRALLHLARQQFDLAEQDAGESLARQPAAHSIYDMLGQIYLAQNRFAEAEAAYTDALQLAPHFALYHYYLGLSQYRQGKHELAAAALATAVEGGLPSLAYDLPIDLDDLRQRLSDNRT